MPAMGWACGVIVCQDAANLPSVRREMEFLDVADIEIPLGGGNVNPVVMRVGDTVRRAMTPASPSVHLLLRHLHESGFTACPKFLGIDDANREILSYINGDTGVSEAIWKRDAPLIATALMLRTFHDASASYPRKPRERWAFSHPDARRHETICHNDFAPYNFVFADDLPHAVIDFDLAGPGPRLWDVAYAVYWMTPLSFGAADMAHFARADLARGSRRLRLFCARYGVAADAALLAMVGDVLAHLGESAVTYCDFRLVQISVCR